MDETRRLQEQESTDNQVANDINSKATSIMMKEGISYIKALNKAKELSKNKV